MNKIMFKTMDNLIPVKINKSSLYQCDKMRASETLTNDYIVHSHKYRQETHK